MAESVTIARPYAQALFRLGKDGQSLAAWSERLQRLSAVAEDPEMARVIGNPKLSANQVADLFISLASESRDKELSSFIGLLAENERFDILPQISEIFERLKSADEGVKEAVITSAFPLNDVQLAQLVEQLESHFTARLEPRIEVDASLIGGVKVAVGDQILDASVRGKLDAMATALKN